MQVRALALSVGVVIAAGLLGPATGTASAGEQPTPQQGPPLATFDDVPMAAHPATVASYTLRAKLDPALHTLHGEGTIRGPTRPRRR